MSPCICHVTHRCEICDVRCTRLTSDGVSLLVCSMMLGNSYSAVIASFLAEALECRLAHHLVHRAFLWEVGKHRVFVSANLHVFWCMCRPYLYFISTKKMKIIWENLKFGTSAFQFGWPWVPYTPSSGCLSTLTRRVCDWTRWHLQPCNSTNPLWFSGM